MLEQFVLFDKFDNKKMYYFNLHIINELVLTFSILNVCKTETTNIYVMFLKYYIIYQYIKLYPLDRIKCKTFSQFNFV